MLREGIDELNGLVIIFDKKGKCVYCNKKTREYGICIGEKENKYTRKIWKLGEKIFETKKINDRELILRWERRKCHFVTRLVPIVDKNGKIAAVAIFARDITKRVKIMQKLVDGSNRDKLTGLYNRNWVEKMKKRFGWGGRKRDFPLCVVMADIDGAKRVNDEFGHDQGDKFICGVADKLREIFRESDWVARYGDRGDEFMIFLPGVKLSEGKMILARIREKYVGLPVSFGLAVALHSSDVNKAIKKADVEMYKNKRMRKGKDI